MKNKKITLIDILIVLVAVLAVVFVAGRFGKPIGGTKTEKVTYMVLVSDQDAEMVEGVVKSDKVMVDTTEKMYGRVVNVERKPAQFTRFSASNGNFVEQTSEERIDLHITVEVDAVKNAWGYQIGDQKIRVGESQNLGGPGYGVSGYIIDIANQESGKVG